MDTSYEHKVEQQRLDIGEYPLHNSKCSEVGRKNPCCRSQESSEWLERSLRGAPGSFYCSDSWSFCCGVHFLKIIELYTNDCVLLCTHVVLGHKNFKNNNNPRLFPSNKSTRLTEYICLLVGFATLSPLTFPPPPLSFRVLFPQHWLWNRTEPPHPTPTLVCFIGFPGKQWGGTDVAEVQEESRDIKCRNDILRTSVWVSAIGLTLLFQGSPRTLIYPGLPLLF